jgi:hypothetical protein
MTSINIEHLRNYNTKLIIEYLQQQNDIAFEIIIPRDQYGEEDLNFSIFWQYYTAAYAGQKLFNIATSFAHYTPCPEKENPFRFEIEVADIEKLAAVLAFIIKGYYEKTNAMIRYNREAAIYFSDAFEGKTDSETWSLLHIANKYLGK